MPDPLAQVLELSEMPFMDGVNHSLNSLDDLEKCRQFYYWVTNRAVWKQVNKVPATAAYVKQELVKAIASHAPKDLSPVQTLTDVQLGRLGWEAKKTQNTLFQRYGERSRSELSVSELYLFLWYLEGQQQFSLQTVRSGWNERDDRHKSIELAVIQKALVPVERRSVVKVEPKR